VSARFAVGERVRARGLPGSAHTRLPGYLRGHDGVVIAERGDFPLADDRALALATPRVEPLYTVAFDARAIWAEADPRDSVTADLWHSYLEAVR
jgi:nitrile hydratase